MNWEALLNTLLISDTNSLSVVEVFLCFTVPFLLTMPVAWFYRQTTRTNNYSIEFIHALVLFASLTSIITLLIGSNIARAFGLVAALSLIRFRTAIKSSLDAVYLFWALCIGMACGVGFYVAAVMIVVMGVVYMWAIRYFRFGRARNLHLIVKASFPLSESENTADNFEGAAQKYFKELERINVFVDSKQDEKVCVYTAESKLKADLEQAQKDLTAFPGVKKLELANSDAALFM